MTGRLIGLALVVAALGGVFAVYNMVHYELVQPFPVAWNHDADEIELLELLRVRRALVGRLGSARRMAAAGARLLPPETAEAPVARLQAELDGLDARVAALRAALGARAPAR